MTDRAPSLLVVRTDIAPEQEADFNRWYSDVHLPDIVGIPGVRSGRRYRLAVDVPGFPGAGVPSYLAIYELESAEVVQSDAFAERRGWGPFKPFVSNNRAVVYELIASEDQA
jgi:hypothetical protein